MINRKKDIYFIAEIGINHNGSIETARELIDIAVDAGADCVKFQKREPRICVPEEKWNDIRNTPWGKMTYIEYKEKIEFSKFEYDMIDKYCKSKGIDWTVSVWDEVSLDFILDNYEVPFIKIPSACITNRDLLRKAAESQEEIIISIGMSTVDEVVEAVEYFDMDKLTILHCNSGYPSNENELDLSYINILKEDFPKATIGYSGHEIGTLPTIIAATLGAEVIERHITLHREMWGTDHKASLEPMQLRKLLYDLNRIKPILGLPELNVYQDEMESAAKLRK